MSDPHAWRDRAACNGVDTELFFPINRPGRRGGTDRHVAMAKSFCRRCPVIGECLEDAIYHGDEGIRGGMDDEERRVLRRQLKLISARSA